MSDELRAENRRLREALREVRDTYVDEVDEDITTLINAALASTEPEASEHFTEKEFWRFHNLLYEWLMIRAGRGTSLDDSTAAQFMADVGHSSLLRRIVTGGEIVTEEEQGE